MTGRYRTKVQALRRGSSLLMVYGKESAKA